MKKLLLVENFYSNRDLNGYLDFCESHKDKFVETMLGEEFIDFPVIIKNADAIFSKYLDGRYTIVKKESGIFRRPINHIHFESFYSDDDWVFFTALKPTTFNLFTHNSGAQTAFDATNLNFIDFTQWNYTTNILLEENQGLFFRPWLFHSIQGGLIQYYKITK